VALRGSLTYGTLRGEAAHRPASHNARTQWEGEIVAKKKKVSEDEWLGRLGAKDSDSEEGNSKPSSPKVAKKEAEAEADGAKEVPPAPLHIPQDIQDKYEVYEWRHASAILKSDFPNEWEDILALLRAFELRKSWIVEKGKNKTELARWIDDFLSKRGWEETLFNTAIVVDDKQRKSPTHKVDCFQNGIAFEIEWNNKDPFYDRDLNNFRLLFELRTVSVGIIFTRSTELQEIFKELKKGSSYGNSTTHMGKLLPRIAGGGGGGCPLIAIGITKKLYREDL
jgi:hypothetical protein